MGLGGKLFNTIKGASDGIVKVGEEGMNRNAKLIYRDKLDDFMKKNGREPHDHERHVMLENSTELAEKMKGGSLGKRVAIGAAIGVPVLGAAVGTGAAVSSAINGKDGFAYEGLENLMEAPKKADASTDVRGFFTRIGEGLRMISLLIQNLGPLFKGEIRAKDLFSENSEIPDGTRGKYVAPDDKEAPNGPTGPSAQGPSPDAALGTAAAVGLTGATAVGASRLLRNPVAETVGGELAETATKGGFRSVKLGLAGTAVVGGVTFLGSMFNGSSTADAAETAVTTAVPFADAANKVRHGDIEGAELSAAQDAGGLAGFAGGAAGGAALGAAAGSVVPIVGTAIGGVVGGVVGGVAGSIGGSWAGGKIFNVFNTEAEGAPKPDNANYAPAANLTTAPAPARLDYAG